MLRRRSHPPEGTDPYATARERMIEQQLRARGVVMHNVLEAMRKILTDNKGVMAMQEHVNLLKARFCWLHGAIALEALELFRFF